METKNKHTPGPWKCRKDINGLTVFDSQGMALANCVFQIGDEEKANARLIAAAPELLEALKALYNHQGSITLKLGEQIERAIAHAEAQ